MSACSGRYAVDAGVIEREWNDVNKSQQAIADELKNQGYSVVPEFLSEQDVGHELLAFLADAPKFADGVINGIPSTAMAPVRSRIEMLVPAVASLLGLSIRDDRFNYCAIRIKQANGPAVVRRPFDLHRDPKVVPGGVLNWHLDHFSYYLHEDHANWLICYMPILKPSSDLANLALIPYDVLLALDPTLADRVRGRGAMRFRCVEADTFDWFALRFPGQEIAVGDWFAIDDYDDATMGWKIEINLEQHKVVPKLNARDLLIMRADVIHRTNDAGSDRISIRCDGIPQRSCGLENLFGLMKLTARLPFIGKKRRYNLHTWLRTEWSKRLRGS